MVDLRKQLEELLDYYKWDESIPTFRIQALLDAEDTYRTGKPPQLFVAFGSQAGGGCVE